jgi:predicted amino acid racemase
MDFLASTIRRNPELIRAAVVLHQNGEIPPNTHVVDFDSVVKNSGLISRKANRLKLTNYFMTKQFGRNPLLSKAIVKAGIKKAVAIDVEEARILHKNGIAVGNIGHLVQVPTHDVAWVVNDLRPDEITIFSLEKARQVSKEAQKSGLRQSVVIRVVGKNDFFYPFQEGGIPEARLLEVAQTISDLPCVDLVGVTTFPCFRFNVESRKEELLPNVETLKRSVRELRKHGFEVSVVNMPGDTNTETLDLIRGAGGTQGEPGHALTGTTPPNYFRDMPEKPAWVYVSEVSHKDDNRAYVIGGGQLFVDKVIGIMDPLYHGYYLRALAGSDPDTIMEEQYFSEPFTPGYIDYYTSLKTGDNAKQLSVGDSVIMGFRAQAFVTRAKIAVVKDVKRKRREPELLGVFDNMGNLVSGDRSNWRAAVQSVERL